MGNIKIQQTNEKDQQKIVNDADVSTPKAAANVPTHGEPSQASAYQASSASSVDPGSAIKTKK